MCPFCNRGQDAWGELLGQNELAYLITLPEPVLPNSVMVIPKRHVVTPFELTEAEWLSLYDLMKLAKTHLEGIEQPDGFNIGFNVFEAGGQHVPHVHMHVFARYSDEPMAGKGIRYALKQAENARPLK